MKFNTLRKLAAGLLATVALTATANSASAYGYGASSYAGTSGYGMNANVYAQVTQFGAQIHVTNNSAYTLRCSGHVYGMTQYGQQAVLPVNNMILYPGQYSNANLYTYGNAVLVSANADVNCTTV